MEEGQQSQLCTAFVLVGVGGAAGRDPDHPAGGRRGLPRTLLLQTSKERGR